MKQKHVTILYSGGLDSFAMLKLAQYKKYSYNLIHYDIGQEYNSKELLAIQSLPEEVQIAKVDWLNVRQTTTGKDGNACGNIMIPGRNMTLASLAASTFLPDEVWMGGLKGEDHKDATDKNKTFVSKVNNLWKYVFSPYERTPKLVFPLVDEGWGKYDIVKWILDNKLATEKELLNTSSCLSNTKEKNCGHCIVCCRRKFIFADLGINEEYASDPLDNPANLKMIIEMLETEDAEDGTVHYDSYRRREILPGLRKTYGIDDTNELLKILKNRLSETETSSNE